MLELAKNDMQIAFVLCHEIAHWAQGDYTRRGARIPRGVHDIASSELVADIK
jgi:predicted Zn-dependent protease